MSNVLHENLTTMIKKCQKIKQELNEQKQELEQIKRQHQKIQENLTELKYRPYGAGFLQAREHFWTCQQKLQT